MVIQAFPTWHLLKTQFSNDFLAVKFPDQARQWMTIQIKVKNNYRIGIFLIPVSWTAAAWKTDVGYWKLIWIVSQHLPDILQWYLRICSYSV